MSERSIKVEGPGLLTLLGVAFIILKLCGVVDWSWWLVTLPLWGGLAVVLVVFLVAGVVLGLAALLERILR